MSRTLTDPVDDALQAAHKQEVTFVEMAFDSGTVRGTTAPHSIEWDGYTWLGLARIGSISPVEEAGQLEARSITLGLSGIPASMVSTAMGEHYQGRPVNLWLGVYTTEPALRFAFNTDTATPTHGSGTLSVVRGSAGGRYNSAGVYESISSNLPRFTYDPATLTARGLLVEESRQNLFTYTEDWRNTTEAGSARPWGQYVDPDAGVTIESVTNPAGGSTSSKLQATSSGSAQRQTYQNKTGIADSTVMAFSAYFKPAEVTAMSLTPTTKDPLYPSALFNLSTGALISSSADGAASLAATGVQGAASGFKRYYATTSVRTGATTPGVNILLRAANGANYSGASGDGLYGYGAQWEAGAFPSSYIPNTSTTQNTRSADAITCTTTGVATTAGTVRITARTAIGAGTQTLWSLDDGTADERIYIQRNSANEIHALVVDGGVTQADLTLGTVAHDTDFVVVVAWAANSIAGCLSGGSLQVDGAATVPTVTTHRHGHDYATANHWNSTIAVWEAWPARLGDAQLVDLAVGEDNAQPVLADPVGPITYRIDNMTIELGATATVNLTAHSRLADWDRARLKHFNDADQQADYPGDRFCEHAEEMVEKQILW